MNSSWIKDEFRNAYRAAFESEGLNALRSMGLQPNNGPLVGYARVQSSDGFYEPSLEGKPAVVIPAYDRNSDDIYDLIAVDLNGGQPVFRRGLVQYLGERWLELAWVHEKPVRVFLSGLEWLGADCCGLLLADLNAARIVLADAAGIWCSNDREAELIHGAMMRPSLVPTIFVAAETAHAA